MMKVLNINCHLDGYSIMVNNCIDYNIGGAASFFNKDFLKLYCAIWSLYVNYSYYAENDISNMVLSELGLKMNYIDLVDRDKIISEIIKHIDNNEPVLLNTNNAALFYSMLYKEVVFSGINHNIIINGYDKEKEVIYIKEISINSKVISLLTKCNPFSDYKLTFNMILEIYDNTVKIIKNNIQQLFCYISKFKSVDVKVIKKEIYETFVNCLEKNTDKLITLLNDILESGNNKNIYCEQFFRNFYHSYEGLLGVVEDYLCINEDSNYKIIKQEFLRSRYKIILILTKNSFKNEVVNKVKINEMIVNLKSNNKKFLNFLLEKNFSVSSSFTSVNMNKVSIQSDSNFSDAFNQYNIIKEEKVNDEFSYWKSLNTPVMHWIEIDLKEEIFVSKITIEHYSASRYVTKDYSIYIETYDNEYQLLKKVEENYKIYNEHLFYIPIKIRKIKIMIDSPNIGVDFSARIKKICLYQKIY